MSFTSRRDERERGSSPTEVPDRPVSDDPRAPDTPLELNSGDWKATVKRTVREIKDDRIPFAAAGMAFYFFLAIFPAMIALIGVLGLVDVDASGLVDSIRTTLPGGAGDAVAQAVSRANTTSDAASLTATIFGLIAALWSASSGMVGLQSGLNIAYHVEHDRKFIGKRAVALLLLVATAALGIVPSPFFTFGDSTVFTVLGWVLTVVAVMLLFSIFYASPRTADARPGSGSRRRGRRRNRVDRRVARLRLVRDVVQQLQQDVWIARRRHRPHPVAVPELRSPCSSAANSTTSSRARPSGGRTRATALLAPPNAPPPSRLPGHEELLTSAAVDCGASRR